MADYPVHVDGTPGHLPYKTVATFPIGTFLENIAVRSNGSLLVSDMLGGTIHYLDPNAPNAQSTLKEIHTFVPEVVVSAGSEQVDTYGGGMTGEAIVEDTRTTDVFYTFSGQHGKKGTWAVYKLDLRNFDECGTVDVQKLADVPTAVWLNGGTFVPGTSKLVMAESVQGQLICCDVDLRMISIWLEDAMLGKATNRQEWPAANGVQFFRGHIYVNNSDRAVLLRAEVEQKSGEYVAGSLQVLAENLAGDDLAFDINGTAYIATNPQNTVLKLPSMGITNKESKRLIIAGSQAQPEAAGPTAVAFGRAEKDKSVLFAVTTGGILNHGADGVGFARVLRIDVGVQGES